MLDWTVSDEPDDPEHSPHPAPGPPRPQRRWRWPLLIGALASLGALLAWWATQQQTEDRRTRAARAIADRPLPAPLPGLTPRGEPVVESFSELPNGAYQITAVHTYEGVDGASLAFRATRVFGPDGTLQQTPVVSTTLEGQLLHVSYDAADEELVAADLAPYLTPILADACAFWECPDDVRLRLDLSADLTGIAQSGEAQSVPSSNRLFAYARSFVVMSDVLRLPRPTSSGTPVDDETRTYWRRAVAAAALVQLALQVRGHPDQGFFAPPLTHHAFFYALVLRQAARSGVEDARWLALRLPPAPGSTMADLWNMQTRIDHGPGADELELRSAQGFLSPLIGNDEQLERMLFKSLDPDQALSVWLARSFAESGRAALDTVLNLSGDETQSLLEDLADPTADWMALGSCAEGQWIWRRIGGDLRLGLSNEAPAAIRVVSARPTLDGLDLAVEIGDQLALRSARTGRLNWVAGAGAHSTRFAGWLGSLAAYYSVAAAQPTQDLHLVLPDDPEHIIASLTDVVDLVPAPLGDVAVVAGPTRFNNGFEVSGSEPLRVVMPLTGFEVPFTNGFQPAWAPDGQRLAVMLGPEAQSAWGGPFSVGILPDSTQPNFAREIWNPEVIGLPADPMVGSGHIAWAPSGSRVAAVIGLGSEPTAPLTYDAWILGLDRLDALDQLRIPLDLPEHVDAVTELAFSADGQYLSAVFWNSGNPLARWYIAETGALAAEHEAATAVAWAPIGHRAIVLSSSGAAHVLEPGAATDPLSGRGCRSVLWNPLAPP